ncbi:MAG: bifunctional phosphoglucose/phosphomannose isomerase [Chloroflexota bacterium]|nr:bifunctional phosphoglucose/phosphomannose isomerase [Dehalococcoidia bacterium]MDW8252843.1 bifunctional phosphoglucose/phosphomannose isomerase [Chloroflexota bacterium]
MLDHPERLRANDPSNMEGRIREFPEQCLVAWEAAGQAPLPAIPTLTNVVIFGMGGSAIGGDLVRSLTERDARVPILVIRDYAPPRWVGPGTLAIGASYSGTTEETLSAMAAAIRAGATPLALTTGGPLADLVTAAGGTAIPVTYPAKPRAAIAHLFLPLLRVLARLGIVDDRSAELVEAARAVQAARDRWALETPEAANSAKLLARALHERLPVFIAGGHLAPVALRWKGQINENAEGWAVAELLPEMNHNVIVGIAQPAQVARLVEVVFLSSPLLSERIRMRERATAALLEQAGVRQRVITAEGRSLLADQLTLIHLGDWVSYYLAGLRGVDPTRIDPIDRLKALLAASPSG